MRLVKNELNRNQKIELPELNQSGIDSGQKEPAKNKNKNKKKNMKVKNLGRRRSRSLPLKSGGVNFGLVTLSFVTTIVLCLVVLMYIIQVNEIVNQGYIKSTKDKEIQDLTDENEKIKSTIAHSKSINNLQNEEEKLNYESSDPSKVRYVEVTSGVFVVNE